MVNFLIQPEIQAALLTAFLGLIGWAFIQWRKSQQLKIKRSKKEIVSTTNQLPPLPANFIGREEELAAIEDKLMLSNTSKPNIFIRCVGLQGMGGVGKTALATVLAHKLKGYYKSAQIYVNLRGIDSEHLAPLTSIEAMKTIICALGYETKLPEKIDQLTPIYNSLLNKTGHVILFLDNAADGEQIKPLFPPENCLLLVTSRTHFIFPGLTTFKIDCLRPEKSQELLLELAPRISRNEKVAAEMCGHLPLALEIFAGIVNNKKLYSVSELLKLHREKRLNLTSMEATFQITFELLTENIRLKWISLSVFPASFDLAATAAIWEENENSAREAMQALTNASLVEWNETSGRFWLHDLVRQFCNGQITTDKRSEIQLRYAKYYCYLTIAAENLYKKGGENVVRALILFDNERPHVEAIFEWPHSKQDENLASSLVSLLDAMNHIFKSRCHPSQRINWLLSQHIASKLLKDQKAECKALGHLGIAYSDLGNVPEAIKFFDQALSISREIKYRAGESGALGCLGHEYLHLGKTDKAFDFFQKSLAIDREIGNREGESSCLNYLGGIYKGNGDYPQAISAYEQALSICRQADDKRSESVILANLGVANCHLDKIHEGINLLEFALTINREVGDQTQEGAILCSLAQAFQQLGNSERAIEYCEQALQVLRESGNLRGEGTALCFYAVILNEIGNETRAIKMTEQSLRILESIEDPAAEVARKNLLEWRG